MNTRKKIRKELHKEIDWLNHKYPKPDMNWAFEQGKKAMLEEVLEILGHRSLYSRFLVRRNRKKVFLYFKLKDIVRRKLKASLSSSEEKC